MLIVKSVKARPYSDILLSNHGALFCRKIVNESKFLANGLDSNGVSEMNTPEKLKPFSMPPPPNNSPVTTNWSFSSVSATQPVESEWRPQPMDSSSEAVSAEPSELWEKSPDTSAKHEASSLGAQSFSHIGVSESITGPKSSEDSPSKQVSSSDDMATNVKSISNNEAQISEASNSSVAENKVECSTISLPKSESEDVQSNTNADEIVKSSDAEEGDGPERKRMKIDMEESPEADSKEQQPEQVIEGRVCSTCLHSAIQ